MISIVLGSYNRLPFLQLAITSIRNQQEPPQAVEIIVIDGGSTDGSLEWLLAQKDIITLVQHNRGEWHGRVIERRSWGYFMNLAFKCASSKYICMISDDTVLHPDALNKGYKRFEGLLKEGRKVGALAFYWRELIRHDFYHVGTPFKQLMYVNHGMFLKSALEQINFIEEEEFQFYYADNDLAFKLWDAGYEICDAPDSLVEHYPYANVNIRSTNENRSKKDFKALCTRWEKKFSQLKDGRALGEMKKLYVEDRGVAAVFNELHAAVIKKHPHLVKPSFGRWLYLDISWKLIVLKKRIKKIFGGQFKKD